MKARVFVLVLVVVVLVVVGACKGKAPGECQTPRHEDGMSCEKIEEAFWADMANACGDARPALSEALRAVARDETIAPLPVGSEHWRAHDRRSFTLFQASWALLPPECTADFDAKRFPVDDYGRSVRDVSRAWMDPRCRPFEIQGTVDVGVWSFATVLAPRLDAPGKAYLRELLACEERASSR